MFRITLMFSILFSFSVIAVGQQPAAQPTAEQKKADDLAHRAADFAGATALNNARYIAFTFRVERDGKEISAFTQRLDRVTGDYKVSGKRPDGIPFETTVNIVKRSVRGSINGKVVTEKDKLEELFTIASRRFTNDMNWLLMPLELFSPGIHRAYDGERSDSCGRTWDLLKLTFDPGLGFTTGENYWLWINRDTGLVDEWDIQLTGNQAGEGPLEVYLHDYRRVGSFLLSLRRDVKGKNQVMRFDDLQVLALTPKDAFK